MVDQESGAQAVVIATTDAQLAAVLERALRKAGIDPSGTGAEGSDTLATGRGNAPDWMSNEACMTYLGVSRSTLARYRRRGLPYAKVMGRVFIRLADIDAFLTDHMQHEND